MAHNLIVKNLAASLNDRVTRQEADGLIKTTTYWQDNIFNKSGKQLFDQVQTKELPFFLVDEKQLPDFPSSNDTCTILQIDQKSEHRWKQEGTAFDSALRKYLSGGARALSINENHAFGKVCQTIETLLDENSLTYFKDHISGTMKFPNGDKVRSVSAELDLLLVDDQKNLVVGEIKLQNKEDAKNKWLVQLAFYTQLLWHHGYGQKLEQGRFIDLPDAYVIQVSHTPAKVRLCLVNWRCVAEIVQHISNEHRCMFVPFLTDQISDIEVQQWQLALTFKNGTTQKFAIVDERVRILIEVDNSKQPSTIEAMKSMLLSTGLLKLATEEQEQYEITQEVTVSRSCIIHVFKGDDKVLFVKSSPSLHRITWMHPAEVPSPPAVPSTSTTSATTTTQQTVAQDVPTEDELIFPHHRLYSHLFRNALQRYHQLTAKYPDWHFIFGGLESTGVHDRSIIQNLEALMKTSPSFTKKNLEETKIFTDKELSYIAQFHAFDHHRKDKCPPK
jgi:hypothetical protein